MSTMCVRAFLDIFCLVNVAVVGSVDHHKFKCWEKYKQAHRAHGILLQKKGKDNGTIPEFEF